jgi:predicted metal-dependent hydrolase
MKIELARKVVEFGSRKIPYRIKPSRGKTLRIVVLPELQVELFAPKAATDAQIKSLMNRKAAWIARTLDKLAGYQPLPAPKRYISGEIFLYLGRPYRLRVEAGKEKPPQLGGRCLWVYVENPQAVERVRRAVEAWSRGRAAEVMGAMLKRCFAVGARHGIPKPVMRIRPMRRRWGSLSRSGRITLNLHLLQTPMLCIEYVIMHELCHLRHPNHSKAFYALLTRFQPDWRRRKDILDRFRLC